MYLSKGLGEVCDTMVYAVVIPLDFNNYNITNLEVLNIVVACKIWANHWKNKRITILCDNLTEAQFWPHVSEIFC